MRAGGASTPLARHFSEFDVVVSLNHPDRIAVRQVGRLPISGRSPQRAFSPIDMVKDGAWRNLRPPHWKPRLLKLINNPIGWARVPQRLP